MLALTPSMPRLIARLGLAFCFISIGIWEIIDPIYWAGYVPDPILRMTDPALFVRVHGAVLTVVGAGVLIGRQLRIFAGAAVLIMLSILGGLLMYSGFTEIFIRDVAILALAAAILADAQLAVSKGTSATPAA